MYRSIFSTKALKPRIKELKFSIYLLTRNRLTRFAFITAIAILILALIAPYIVPYPSHIEDENNPNAKLLPPSSQYWFGTDELGRDIFSRVIYGTRISVNTALFAIIISILIGIPLGAIAGTFGGKIDNVIMRITDMFLSFPPLLLAISIAAFLGPNLKNAMLAIAISWWPWYARIIRGQAISIKERPFVKASEALGSAPMKIVFVHIVPNCISPVIVQASMDIGGAILTLASLSFLGLGAQPPTPEWGLMVSTSRNYFLNAWWYSIFPGLAIFVMVLVFNLLGDGFREILDPKTRKN